jgi:hypothetical protein
LHANANSEKRLAFPAHSLLKRIDHPGNFIETTPTIRESTDARQNNTIGSRNGVGVAGHDNRLALPAFARCPFECFGS